jgi:hypothetical protein
MHINKDNVIAHGVELYGYMNTIGKLLSDDPTFLPFLEVTDIYRL